MKSVFFAKGAVIAAACCLFVAPAHGATPESSLNKCQKTIAKQVAKLARGYHKSLSTCLDKISKELIQRGSDDAARAVKSCAKKLLKIVSDDSPDKTLEAKMRAKIDKACDPRVNERLQHSEDDILGGGGRPLATASLNASALGEYCSAFGGDGSIDSLSEWQDCLQGAAAFHAYHQIAVEYPRAVEWLNQLRADLFRSGVGLEHDGSVDALDGVVTSVDPDKDAFIDKLGPFTCGVDVVYAESIDPLDGDGINRVCVSTCYLLVCTDTLRPAGVGLPHRRSYDVALGDLDGDGAKEAVFANYGYANRIYDGPYDLVSFGVGGFQIARDIDTVELFTSGVALGDLDHDDDLDLVFANHDEKDETNERAFLGAPNKVCRNDLPTPISCADISSHTDFSYDVALGDVNGDGHTDVVFANGDCCSLNSDKFYNRLCLNDGTGSFDCEHLIDFPRQIASLGVDLGDLDNDGDLDAVFADAVAYASRVCLNDGSGSFTCSDVSNVFADTVQAEAVALGDLDGDGNLEAVFANSHLPTETGAENRVCVGDGSGSFPVCASISSDTNTSMDVALADADGDGDLDVFFANEEGSSNPDQRNRICLNGGNFIFNCFDVGTDETATQALAVGHLYP